MKIRSINLLHIWSCFSRTRPLPSKTTATPDRQQRSATPERQQRSKHKYFDVVDPNFAYFVYQGVGVTGPFGLCYVVGVVVGGIGSEGITVALIIASITSLLTGLCYAELLSSSHQCSGNVITAVYQLVGEFPAFLLSLYSFSISCFCFAALSKALSATVEELTHGKMSNFLTSVLGTLPSSALPPDLFAAGAALLTSVLLACGLKQAGFLRTVMNILCLLGFLFFLIVGSTHTRTSTSKVEESPPERRQIITGAGILSCLFFQFLELGRRSKAEVGSRRKLPLAITSVSVVSLIIWLSLAIILSQMMDNRAPVSGAPLLRALQLRDIDWARFTMGSLQVIILGLGISEAGETISRQLVTMASNGFIPSFFSQECHTSFTHARAHLVGGMCVGALAMVFTHVYLLEIMAANILLTNTVICFIILYRPHRCAYDSICTVSVTPGSKTISKPTKYNNPDTSSNVTFFKKGFHLSTLRNKNYGDYNADEEVAIPLLTSLHASDVADRVTEDYQSHFSTVTDHVYRVTSDEDDLRRLNECSNDWSMQNINARDSKQSLATASGDIDSVPVSQEEDANIDSSSKEISSDEDIDMIVAEFKEQLRVSTSGYKIKMAPTGLTARKALLIVMGISLTTFAISCCSLIESKNYNQFSFILRISFIVVLSFIDFLFLLLLTSLPTLRVSSGDNFRVPFAPFIPSVTLSLNILLVTELLTKSVWALLSLHVLGVVWYTFYVSRYSVASKYVNVSAYYPTDRKMKEFIRLSPLIPATIYTSRPQHSINTGA